MSNSYIYEDDCMNIFKRLPDNSIDLIVSDVPYPTTPRGCAGNSGGMLQKEINKKGKVFENNSIDCTIYAPEMFRVLKDGSHCYIMTNHVNLLRMLNVFTQTGFHFIKSLIRKKDNKIMGKAYMSQFEYILFFRKGKFVKVNDCGISDVLEVPNRKIKGEDGNNLHDTEKPVELMEILVKQSSKEGDWVMDPFLGIGATAIACKKNNRNFIGIEIDGKYANIATKRINNLGE